MREIVENINQPKTIKREREREREREKRSSIDGEQR